MASARYLRAALLGLATGSRSQSGITALAWNAPTETSWSDPLGRRRRRSVTKALARRWAKASTAFALTAELSGDKAPNAPSRSTPGPLAARLVLGGVAGYALAERDGGSRLLSAAIGIGGSALTTIYGPKYRALAAEKIPQLGPLPRDLPGALAEDVFAVKLAWIAAR